MCKAFYLVPSARQVLLALSCIAIFATADPMDAQESAARQEQVDQRAADAEQEKRFSEFEKLMTGATLKGNFTIIGQDTDLTAERYVIESAKKYKEGDYWIFKVRITYGDRDETLTFPIQVKWAENTPVITLEKGEIPVLKNYGARVVIDDGKYAGTWSAPQGGGHLFGVIERSDAQPDKQNQSDKDDDR